LDRLQELRNQKKEALFMMKRMLLAKDKSH